MINLGEKHNHVYLVSSEDNSILEYRHLLKHKYNIEIWSDPEREY